MSEKILLTSQKLANLYPKAAINERAITSICQKAGVPNVGRKGYEVFPATDAIITHYKKGYEARDAAGESDNARRRKAEADTAELSAMRERGEVIMRDSALAWFADERTEVRRIIERFPGIATAQKNALLNTLAKMKPKSIE